MTVAYGSIFLAALFFSLQFIFSKMYQTNSDSSLHANLWMTQMQALWVLLIFPAVLGFQITFTPQAVGYAFGYAVSSLFCGVASLWAFSLGKIATVTLYMLIGGQAVPFLYALIFTGARPTWLNIVGFAVMLLACLPNMLEGEKPKLADTAEKKHRPLFLVLCIVTFFGNGLVSVFSDVNAKSSFGANSNTFLVLYALWTLGFTLVLLTVLTVRRHRKGQSMARAVFGGIGKSVGVLPILLAFGIVGIYTVLNSVGNIFSLQAAGTPGMQSSVQFPLLNSLIMVLTAVLGRIFYHEKVGRRELAGILMAVLGILLFLASYLVYGR